MRVWDLSEYGVMRVRVSEYGSAFSMRVWMVETHASMLRYSMRVWNTLEACEYGSVIVSCEFVSA